MGAVDQPSGIWKVAGLKKNLETRAIDVEAFALLLCSTSLS
jgi:hypothetical protein